MYQQDWLDDLRWGAILLGVLVALLLQIVLTVVIFRPLGIPLGWGAVILVQCCVAVGAFVSGWRAQVAMIANGLVAALSGAVISLIATVLRAPTEINILSVLFLFGTFALMGLLGGLIAGRLRALRGAR